MMNKREFKLTVELVPKTLWYASLFKFYQHHNQLSKWRRIKKELLEKEGNRCWVCGAAGVRLEAHEFWDYDDGNYIQKLTAIHHLCRLCHFIKHIGLWCYTNDGREKMRKIGLTRDDLIKHFCKVNGCSKEDFEEYVQEALNIFRERNQHHWTQDFGEYNVID
jgi:hypothetical protein